MDKFLSTGDVIARAAREGLSIKGDIHGCTINGVQWNMGAITSVAVTAFLSRRYPWNASAIPVGFNNTEAPSHIGAIARQFPALKLAKHTDSQADSAVVKAYLMQTPPPADTGKSCPKWNIPSIPLKKLFTKIRRTIVLNESLLPEKFYVKATGDTNEIQDIEDICDENGYMCLVEGSIAYFSNIDTTDLPPRPQDLCDQIDFPTVERKQEPQNTASQHEEAQHESEKDAGHPVSEEEEEDICLPLPEEWFTLLRVQTIKMYQAVSTSPDFAASVSSMNIKLGSNKHKLSRVVLEQWRFGEKKSVADFLGICEDVVGDGNSLAKMFHAILSHIRVEGTKLVRVAPVTGKSRMGGSKPYNHS